MTEIGPVPGEQVIYENPRSPWGERLDPDSDAECVRLGDPAYYVPDNPYTDDEGFLPHDGGPMPEWCRGKYVQFIYRDGLMGICTPSRKCDWHRVADYRIVGEGSEDREAGDSSDFRTELMGLLNRWSKENDSDTPDFILRDYLCDCLMAFDRGVQQREQWYGRQTTKPATAMLDQEPDHD